MYLILGFKLQGSDTKQRGGLKVCNSGEMLELKIPICVIRILMRLNDNTEKIKQSRKMGSKESSEAHYHFFKFWQKRAKKSEREASRARGKAGEGGAMKCQVGKATQGGNK